MPKSPPLPSKPAVKSNQDVLYLDTARAKDTNPFVKGVIRSLSIPSKTTSPPPVSTDQEIETVTPADEHKRVSDIKGELQLRRDSIGKSARFAEPSKESDAEPLIVPSIYNSREIITKTKQQPKSSGMKKAISFTKIKPGNSDESMNESDASDDKDDSAINKGLVGPVEAQAIIHKSKFEGNVQQNATALSLDSKRSSVSGQSAGGKSKHSTASSQLDTTFGRLMIQYDHLRTKFLESEEYRLYRLVMDNAKYQVLALGAIEACLIGAIYYIILVVLNTTIPSIRLYNLIHIIMAFLGKLLLLVGWQLALLIRKGFAAVELQTHKRGTPLPSLANVDPDACRTVNRLLLYTLLLVEGGMWTLSFFIDWEPVNTYLGTFPCTLPTYRTPWNFTSDLSTVLGSQTDWGILEVFGLPLTQGLIGGQSASPNASPSRLFEMNGPGIAYLIESVCTEPIISTAPPTKNSEVKIISSEYWGQIYNVGFQVKLPAGTHNMINFNTSDVYQKCLVSVVSGAATLTFGYTSDEWSTMTMNSIIEIVVNNKITIPLGDSIKYDFGAIHQAFGSTEVLYSNITGWIAQGIQLAMNGSDLKSYTVRQPQVSLLNWAIDANTGLYDVQSTWKGIAASIAIIGHYVLGQSDGTDSAMCAYRGSDGWGQITAPAWITTALIAILICSTVMLVVCVSSWMLIVGGGPHIDKCVEMIDNPLRTLYYMRESVGNIVTKIRGSDIGQVSLVEHLSREYIRFGEDKTTRGNEVGTLVIDEPSKVVKIARHREVA